jgi:hypothetical protein
MPPTTPERPDPAPPTPSRKQQDPPRERNKPGIEEPPDEQSAATQPDEHEGATEEETGDLTGPGPGYDQEPEKVKDKGGVVPS